MSTRRAGALAAVVALVGFSGCSTLLAVRGQQKRADQNALIGGTVTTDYAPSGPLIVGLIARDGDRFVVVDYFVAEKPGPWVFGVSPGEYWVAAFEDANRDTRYADEPALRPDPDRPLRIGPGEARRDITLKTRARDASRVGRLR